MIKIFSIIREYIYWFIFSFSIDFYQINPVKIKKAKKWLNNKLQNISKQEGIKIEYKDIIQKISEKEQVTGRYFYRDKKIQLLNHYNYSYFQKQLVWMHELGHHFFKKVGFFGNESEEMVDRSVLSIIKTFPKWVIKTMQTSIEVDFNIKEEDFNKIFNLTYYNIKKSERR